MSEALEPVRARERALRGQLRPPWSAVSGPDPVDVLAWEPGFVGLLRGASAIVRLDAEGRECDRVDGPAGVVGWTRDGDQLHVVGERSDAITIVAVGEADLRVERSIRVAGVSGLRAVQRAPDGGWIVADRHRGRLLEVGADGTQQHEVACPGALDVRVHQGWVIANCMLEHTVRVFDPQTWDEIAAVTHDGPIWAVAPRTVDGDLELAVAGVENRPLDRSDGSFGYIDPFVFRVRLQGDRLVEHETVDLGLHGVIMPKHLRWRGETLWVTGAGADAMAQVDFEPTPRVTVQSVPAGLTGFAWHEDGVFAADPLLDRWVHVRANGKWTLIDIEAEDARTAGVRVGEALVFTTLMAPKATAQGRSSRFTCETCHFEGTTDGRVHYTGRGEVLATTKTLRGLVGNQPHFSRALDRTTTDMIHNEFRVANANTPQDPWFDLKVATVPWLSAITDEARYEPAALRGAVLEFLAAFTPERNPATLGREAFSALERRGAARFEALCEACHQSRTVADDPSTRQPPSRWEAAVFGDGALLWARSDRYRTGVEPYVHEEGARVPSLRRLWVKRPFLTQGTAQDLAAVLEAVRLDVDAVHGGASGTPLSAADREALAAFLDLL